MKTLITNALLVNEGTLVEGDLLIDGERIAQVGGAITATDDMQVVDAAGRMLMPGMIDDQVHFREPGLTSKGDLFTESRAAVVGGTTSFMDMPNVNPAIITRDALRAKYELAAGRCHGNFAFYFGATNDNIDEIRALKPEETCGIKAFMGASTGSLLVDDDNALDLLFKHAPVLVVTHCEDSPTIWANEREARDRYGDAVPIEQHPEIRSSAACVASSQKAMGLARKYDARLHVLHLTTADEMAQFEPGPLAGKRITGEACIHHLWFHADDYARLGTRIKCNPAVKYERDRDALREALVDGRLDVIATDHAPHLLSEKDRHYFAAPAGMPLTQHALVAALDLAPKLGQDATFVVSKCAHMPAELFGIAERGYLREGYYADLALVNPDAPHTATDANVLYKCEWTPFVDTTFQHRVESTWVNGTQVFDGERVSEQIVGQPLRCDSSRAHTPSA
ncbi:MAG: dihydroorotase [Pseudomonadota bacterium]